MIKKAPLKRSHKAKPHAPITISYSGSFDRTKKYLKALEAFDFQGLLEKYALKGVNRLEMLTPKDTGLTANSWYYWIDRKGSNASTEKVTITWKNSNYATRRNKSGDLVSTKIKVSLLIQYGHGNGYGGYVPARDYINPAIKPVVDELMEELEKELSKL